MVQTDLALGVYSEVSRLRRVMVHTPGPELSLISPANRLALLFEDILFEEAAREEHQHMCRVFETIVGTADGVLQITDLLREAFEQEEARFAFIEGLCKILPESNFQAFESELQRLDPEVLYDFAITGRSPLALHALPLPNLLFTRDLSAVVGQHIVLSHAATSARVRESLIISIVLQYHPQFAAHRDALIHLPEGVTFEGGDLLVANEKIILIGHSERTSFGAIMAIAKALFSKTTVEHILVVDLPKQRASMHLDTVFTFSDWNECVVFPPIIEQRLHNVLHLTRGDAPDRFVTALCPNLKTALEDLLDHPLTYIPCGGETPIHQYREQWTDGANLFALAPGVVVAYERNQHTFEALREHGYRVVSAEGFLSYHAESAYEPGGKMAIKLEGHELSRGRGGARCMTLPLARDTK